MTHIMVPDGVLPWWLSAAGWLVTAVLVSLALWRLRGTTATRMVPYVAVMTALMFVIMSLELVPIGYELHLTVLTGMVIGPWYGVIAALLFNFLRAFIGDGAFTNIGLNTGIIWLEIALGAALWRALRPLARRRAPLAAGLTTLVSLMLATVAFLAVVAVSTEKPGEIIDTGSYSVQTGGFDESPLARGLFAVHVREEQGNAAVRATAEGDRVGFMRFAVAFLGLTVIGSTIEAVLTAAVVAFIARVRPTLLGLPPVFTPTDEATDAAFGAT